MDFRYYQERDYLGSWSFEPNVAVIKEISGFEKQVLPVPNTKQTKSCLVIQFKGTTYKMVVSTGKGLRISRIAGSTDPKHWIGVRIAMYRSKAMIKGKEVDAFNIIPEKPPEGNTWDISDRWEKLVKADLGGGRDLFR
jgi:hypothetical protein